MCHSDRDPLSDLTILLYNLLPIFQIDQALYIQSMSITIISNTARRFVFLLLGYLSGSVFLAYVFILFL